MAKRKLSQEEKALDELAAQTLDLRTTIGKNTTALIELFKKQNNTMGQSLLRVLFSDIAKKGIRTFGGEIKVEPGKVRKGQRLPESQQKPGLVHERIGRSPISGQEVVTMYPISYTLYEDRKAIAKAGYTAGTRAEFEQLIGPQQIDTLLLYVSQLNEPGLAGKLRKMPKKQKKKLAEKALAEKPSRIPKHYLQLLKDHNIDAKLLNQREILKVGAEIAEEKYSALLWALDPGKKRNIINWFKERHRRHLMPAEVREAWTRLMEMPHTIKDRHMQILTAYQFQEKPEKRTGLAGDLPKELRWLEKNQKRPEVYAIYGRKISLSAKHRPFNPGKTAETEKTIDEFLDEPYWTVADKQGILNKYPLAEFRQEWNKYLLDKYFEANGTFKTSMQELNKIVQEDSEKTAAAKGHKNADTMLGRDYAFAKEMLERMAKGEEKGSFKRAKLAKKTSIHKSEEEIDRLYVISAKARLSKDLKQKPELAQKYATDALKQRYVSEQEALDDSGINITLQGLVHRLQKTPWEIVLDSRHIKNKLKSLKLSQKRFKQIIREELPQIAYEAEYGLVRKSLAYAAKKAEAGTLSKLYQMVKEARQV